MYAFTPRGQVLDLPAGSSVTYSVTATVRRLPGFVTMPGIHELHELREGADA